MVASTSDNFLQMLLMAMESTSLLATRVQLIGTILEKHVIWQMGQEDGLVLTEQGGFRFNDGVEVKQYQSVYVDRLGDMTSEDYEVVTFTHA
jgi:hypothetical protein